MKFTIRSMARQMRFLIALCLACFTIVANAEDIDIYKTQVCSSATAANYRFIFVVDNSGSMSNTDFSESKLTVDASIQHVLATLDQVQVAVVQYGSNYNGSIHTYEVSVPFTDDMSAALTWDRRYGTVLVQDHTPASLAEMRLDNVYAPGGALDITDADNVQFVFFTDGERDIVGTCCSSIVAEDRTFIKNEVLPGFGEYDALKNGTVLPGGINAQFTVLNNNSRADSLAASAAISSVGGSFTGAVEANPADPDGSGILPRRFVAGTFNSATDIDKVLSVLDEVVHEITRPPASTSDIFTQASIDVDRASFSTDNRAFFSLFAPSTARSWRGNLKGYFFDHTGLLDAMGIAATTITDDDVSFKDTAQSFWSAAPDGANVLAGGANEQIESAGVRDLYTYLGNESSGARLQHRLEAGNTNITAAHLNVGTESQRVDTLNWLQAAPMGDSLHTLPVSVRYENRTVIYSATNQGVLHAIDSTLPVATGVTTGGEELWGYVPKELLPNLPLLAGATVSGEHIYGIDGKITRWHNDENLDGIVNGSDTMLLIFGQRRGGRSYYALDVTNPTAPEFKWQITGGVTTGFADLMQTWSTPALITVKHTGEPQTAFTKKDTERVLVFSGGYDATKYDGTNSASNSGGGAIYMVDRSGGLLWKTESGLKYSMPADLAAIDSNNDAIADRIYAADLGGQIWRVDLSDLSNISNTEVNLFASVQDQGYQPFFYPPSVSYSYSSQGNTFSIIIGSGNRTDPLDETAQNYLYKFEDTNIDVGPPAGTFSTLKADDLYDVTDFDLGSSDDTTRGNAKSLLDQADGWMLKLSQGEKFLGDILAIEGVVMAVTYKPIYDGDPSVCETRISSENRLYTLSIGSGSPVMDNNGELTSDLTTLTASNRSEVLIGDGIISGPIPTFPKEGDAVKILVGKEVVADINQKLVTKFWYAK